MEVAREYPISTIAIPAIQPNPAVLVVLLGGIFESVLPPFPLLPLPVLPVLPPFVTVLINETVVLKEVRNFGKLNVDVAASNNGCVNSKGGMKSIPGLIEN